MKNYQNAVIIDVETTGLNSETDKIIEIGLMRCLAKDGVLQLQSMYSALQDPGIAIPAEITKLTGLDDAMVAGQSIHWETVQGFFADGPLIIAHNAEFDRGFLRHQSPLIIDDLSWACSVRHIDWDALGFRSRALNYLAADHGFVNPFAHRALFDCATTFRLVAPHFAQISSRCQEREYKIYAMHSPFEKKDLLKSRRYQWDGQLKVWFKMLTESHLESERIFLIEQIYDGHTRHKEEAL